MWKTSLLTISRAPLRLSDVRGFWSWHHRLRIWALLTVIWGLTIAALQWMFGFVKLKSDGFCGNSVFKMNTQFCCHLCCSSSVFPPPPRNNPSQCTTISLSCRISPTVPLRWCCLPMIRVCRHKLRKLPLSTYLKMWQFLSEMLQLKAHWKSDKSPTFWFFHTVCQSTQS
jgi:hypothetical protein